MSWQDFVRAIGGVVFVIALIPSVLSPDKPAFTTSILNAAVLFSFAVVYVSLELWFAAATTRWFLAYG